MKTMKQIAQVSGLILSGILLLATGRVTAYDSGSTGADGDFNPTNSMPGTGWSISNNVVTVTNKSDGVFNFGTIYIETNWIVKFTRNALNTPVYLLASNTATIKGTIELSAVNGTTSNPGWGGPGGYDGGAPDNLGFGPGAGGNASYSTLGYNRTGGVYGVIDILPAIGGSGGNGGYGKGGGGGGGTVVIASSATMTISGSILAKGAHRGDSYAGFGSGGAIRLLANTIEGEGLLNAKGGYDASIGYGGDGRIRLEANELKRISLSLPPFTFGPPTAVFLATNPTIRVTSIAGQAVPWPPTGSLTMPDMTNNVSSIVISVAASNVTPGTSFKLIITPVAGTNIIANGTLQGTYAYSTNDVTMSVYTDRVWRVNALIDYVPRP